MKLRSGFVSNSSSASFILRMGNLTDEQVNTVEAKLDFSNDHPIIKQMFGSSLYHLKLEHDSWDCTKGKGQLEGDTFMDNGELEEWFQELKIPESEYDIFDDQLLDWDDDDED